MEKSSFKTEKYVIQQYFESKKIILCFHLSFAPNPLTSFTQWIVNSSLLPTQTLKI